MFRRLALTALCSIQFALPFSTNLVASAEGRSYNDSEAVAEKPTLRQGMSQADPISIKPYVEGEVLVKWKQPASTNRMAFSLRAQGLTRSDTLERSKVELLKINNRKSVDEVVKELQSDPNVAYVQPNFIYRAQEVPAIEDARFGEQWGLQNTGQAGGMANFDIDAPEGWKLLQDKGVQLNEVVVAVVDSGIDLNHPDLQGLIWTNPDEVPNNGIDDDGNCTSTTCTAGILRMTITIPAMN